MRPSFRIVIGLFVLTALPAFAVEADPSKLKPTAEQIARAEALAVRLGSDIFLERDTATRDLAGMGRLALSVVDRVLAETDDAEVRNRCEALRPPMLEEDLKARLESFVADAEGKYDHKLPAWDKFKAIVGNTADTRTLFTKLNEYAPTAKLLTASVGPREEFSALVVARRMEIYNRMYGRMNRFNGGMVVTNERVQPSVTDAAGQLFAESLLGTVNDRRYSLAMTRMFQDTGAVKENLTDAVKGDALRKLFVHWCDTRTDPYELNTAMTTTMALNLKDVPAAKYAVKMLEATAAPMPSTYKATAITTLARLSGKENLPLIVKQFDDKSNVPSFVVNPNGQVEQFTIQQRDVALAMALAVTEQKPEDYGFTVRNTADAAKFTHTNYKIESDEKRTAAFKKWDVWQTKNPLKK